VVAKTFLLDGKEVTIKIKEKDVIVVDADADIPVTEAKENGAELTTLKATVENGVAKIKVKLRPKTDEDLKKWKEKLANGIKDGTYKYTVKNTFKVSSDLDKIASTIEKKSNEALAPNHHVSKVDISVLLAEGATYTSGNSFEFPKYKKAVENLWLKVECQGDTIKHEGEFLKKDGEYFVIGKKCECEARVRAFMRMLRVKEGTDGEKGYTKQFSGKQFTDMSKHPHEVIKIGTYASSAAGAYQIMGDIYDGLKTYRTKYNILNFDQESQDKLCLVILKHNYTTDRPNSFYNPVYWKDDTKTIRDTEKENNAKEKRKRFKGQNGDIVKMLIDNNYDKAVLLSALCWASLPDAPYGQPIGTKEECKENYEKFLKEELADKSDLYLKKGFLKEFGYDCCSDNKGSVKWQNPLKNNQITIYTFGGSKRPWRSAFGRVRTDMTGSDNGARPHHGLDLFANIGTEVYACLPGEVVSLTPGTGYGNGFVFKIDAGYLDEFVKQRRDYSPYYIKSKRTYDSQKYDITGYGDFEEYEGISESTDVYLMYAHLSEVLVKLNEKITESNMDKVLGKTGTSGATNTKGPHLHFEIRSKQNPSGYTERYNPAFYIDYKNENQLTDAERETQDTAMGQ
jgi:murein DD-endopeptidase MepM/ murein hydrolase activator NlpD